MRAVAAAIIVVTGCGAGGEGAPDAAPACANTVIYLNRDGGSYTQEGGPDNSVLNQMSTIAGPATFSAYDLEESRWQALLACVASKFAPFAVEVTDVDPGSRNHFEATFVPAGEWSMTGIPDNYASLGTLACDPFLRPIALMNTEVLDTDQKLCEATAQTLMFSQGLDVVTECSDVMAISGSCGERTFTDEAHACARGDCYCEGTTQNSYQALLDILGPACE